MTKGKGKCKSIFYYNPPKKELPKWQDKDCCFKLIDNFILLSPETRLTIYSDGIDQFTALEGINDDFVVPDKFKDDE